ncbi:MAG: hypothetical protein ACXVC1_06625 [Tumebacillaceae bacterium]
MNREKKALIDILESIAAEEGALAQIINAEAEQLKAFAEKIQHQQLQPTSLDDLITLTTSVNRLLLTTLTTEIVLLNKFDVAAELLSELDKPEEEPSEEEDGDGDNEEDEDEDGGFGR